MPAGLHGSAGGLNITAQQAGTGVGVPAVSCRPMNARLSRPHQSSTVGHGPYPDATFRCCPPGITVVGSFSARPYAKAAPSGQYGSSSEQIRTVPSAAWRTASTSSGTGRKSASSGTSVRGDGGAISATRAGRGPVGLCA